MVRKRCNGNFKRVLKEKGFAVTAEIGPPKGADSYIIHKKGSLLSHYADAFNVTDNQTAVVRLSSLAGSIILYNMGLDPILQITCRDRNRIAIQSDVLGAAALGIQNILCITGDHQCFGNHPAAKGVYDLDSIQLVKILRDMQDKHKFESGDDIITGELDLFIGSTTNPFAEPCELQLIRLKKKIRAGAAFVQTQSVFNLKRFLDWMDNIRSWGLHTKIHILAGVTPLKSLKMTKRMKYHVPGVDIPDEIYIRMKNANNPKKEGYNIALELINEIKNIKGIDGIHITALFWEEIIPSLIKEAGLLPRP